MTENYGSDYSYYGRITPIKIDKGIHYFMVDQYSKDIMDKYIEEFKKESNGFLNKISEISPMKKTVSELKKIADKIVNDFKSVSDRLDKVEKKYKALDAL